MHRYERPPGLSSQIHRPVFDIWAQRIDSRYTKHREREVALSTLTLCPTVTPVIGWDNAIDYGCAHRRPRGSMKDRKKAPEDSEET